MKKRSALSIAALFALGSFSQTAYELFLNSSSGEASIRKVAREETAALENLVETALKSRNAINALGDARTNTAAEIAATCASKHT